MTIEARFYLQKDDFVLDVDLKLPSSGVTAVFGPSGCGKTTLLRAIAGLEQAAGGLLKIGDVVWQDDDRFVPPHKRAAGYVFQETSLFPHLDVRRNLEYGLKRVPEKERRVSLDHAIDLLGIGQLLGRYPHQLSGGERQRAAIARALAVSPRILLLDEPLAALDQPRKQEIMPYLESLHRELEIPVIYVSHAPEEVARLADYLVLMKDGTALASGPIKEMLTRLDLPLAHDQQAAAVIDAVVAGHDEKYHLTHLKFPGGLIRVTRNNLPVGQPVRVRIAARDVSLTLAQQTGTSILNIFPATIVEVADDDAARVTVRLNVGGVPLLSRVTRRSAALLELQPGKSVFAQVKSVALLS